MTDTSYCFLPPHIPVSTFVFQFGFISGRTLLIWLCSNHQLLFINLASVSRADGILLPPLRQALNVVRHIMKTLLILLLLIPLSLFAQKKNYNFEFTFVFGDCFRGDSVDVKIQNLPIISGKVNSGTAGKANLSITQQYNYLSIFYNGKTTKAKKINSNPSLKVEFCLNGQWYIYNFNLKNGVIFLIQYCNDEKTKKKIFTVEQGNEPLLFI